MSPYAATPWPAALAGTPAIAVIEQAIARHRLSHSLLLHGDEHDTLVAIAHAIADRLLNPGGTASQSAEAPAKAEPRDSAPSSEKSGHKAPPISGPHHFPPGQHPDCFTLRPAGKMRQISADATRALINQVQVSPAVAPRKVAILHEVDRMHLTAANIDLKTLEEPPANTTLLLLTTRPYALLPTIRSRVLHFRFPSAAAPVAADGWAPWLEDYRAWLSNPVQFTPALWQVAWEVETDQVAGMVRGFINEEENGQYQRRRGWSENISTRRPWRKRGLARALIVRTLRMFKEMGMTESALGVDAQNPTGALQVYEACGFRAVKQSKTYRKRLV